MDFLNEALQAYVANHTSPEPDLLRRLNRETHAKVLLPRMLSGHVQGRVLAFISHMLQPRHILEIGTYTGYSAICLAEGLHPEGILHTIDVNEELEEMVRKYFEEAGLSSRIRYHIGRALEVIPTIEATFDLVFIDADKVNYPRYFEEVVDRVRPGGFILADNVLWSGKVVQTPGQKIKKDTQAILDFNRVVHQDDRVENVLLPIRDGLMVMRRK